MSAAVVRGGVAPQCLCCLPPRSPPVSAAAANPAACFGGHVALLLPEARERVGAAGLHVEQLLPHPPNGVA